MDTKDAALAPMVVMLKTRGNIIRHILSLNSYLSTFMGQSRANSNSFYYYGDDDDEEDEEVGRILIIQPFSIFFLFIYIVIIITQFFCMLWHR